MGGDLAAGRESSHGAPMTRRDQVKPGPSFTALSQPQQASAWARGALYGGGLTLMAVALALGWTHGRPDPRRRAPRVPAPAWATRPRPGR